MELDPDQTKIANEGSDVWIKHCGWNGETKLHHPLEFRHKFSKVTHIQ